MKPGGSSESASNVEAVDNPVALADPLAHASGHHSSACARLAGSFTSALVVSLIVALLTGVITTVRFPPLESLIEADDKLYYALARPPLRLRPDARPVIFVDIDDATLDDYHRTHPQSPLEDDRTPRSLLASIVARLRAAHAGAIFLDVDLRDTSDDDGALRAELSAASGAPVLLPYFLVGGAKAKCAGDESASQHSPARVSRSTFDDTLAHGRVRMVHAMLQTGAYGDVQGTCSAYRLSGAAPNTWRDLPAAMVEAVHVARADSAGTAADTNPIAPGRLIRPFWRVLDVDTRLTSGGGGKLVYMAIPASQFLWSNSDLSTLRGSLVIVGSTVSASTDRHLTPAGDLPGALVHANLAIEIQAVHQPTNRVLAAVLPWIMELLIALMGAAMTTLMVRRGFHRRQGARARLTIGERVACLSLEVLVLLGYWLVICAVILFTPKIMGSLIDIWRFSFIATALGGAILMIIEITFLLAERAAEFAEASIERCLSERPVLDVDDRTRESRP